MYEYLYACMYDVCAFACSSAFGGLRWALPALQPRPWAAQSGIAHAYLSRAFVLCFTHASIPVLGLNKLMLAEP